ncbi:hypothetical protein XarbCFBP8132_19730 [Xanthomonas arboricola]|uniref:hypothetical protein n=1 Tax=Xanthomonas arboricola TaxID=56448 RepID=UPI000CEEDF90|nr:hypothetical protein [Xanthomonas arboricola]PPT35780.1 hypothetical protein XarbCFBP8132_19730 [Xanthomonas arboricola]
MQALKFFALSCLAVIVFDAVASLVSLVLGFPYTYAAFGSAILYIAFGFFANSKFGFWAAVLLGLAMGITDATLGWAVSWAIGPGRLAGGTLTLSVWFYTTTFAVILGAIYGLIGGGIGVLTGRWRAT